jgi:hypothetical protein
VLVSLVSSIKPLSLSNIIFTIEDLVAESWQCNHYIMYKGIFTSKTKFGYVCLMLSLDVDF